MGQTQFTPIPIFGRGFSSKSKIVTSQLLTNLYREPQGDPDRTSMALYGTPGHPLQASLGANPARGAHQFGNFVYAVHGNTLYQINNAWVYTAIGTLNSSNGRVDMEDNGFQLMIVDGVNGYTFTFASATFAVVANPNFPNGADTVCFLAGYFVVNDPAFNGRFRWCSIYDGTTWNALDFANAEFSPDSLVACRSSAGYLYLFGYSTTEVWAASGDTRVFARVGGAGLEYGLPTPWAVSKFKDSSLMFLGRAILGQAQVWQILGSQVKPISTPDTTHDINLQPINGATSYSYSLDLHGFFQLNFPNVSYLYDDLSDSWSEVSSNGGRHIGEIRIELFGVPYVADYANGNWYKVDQNTFTDNGSPIVREAISKHMLANHNQFTLDELLIDMEVGVGVNTGQGANPVVMVSWSKDGGKTFGNEVWAPMGAIGAYMTRIWLRMLGRAFDFVLKLRVSDPVKVVFLGAAARVS